MREEIIHDLMGKEPLGDRLTAGVSLANVHNAEGTGLVGASGTPLTPAEVVARLL